MDLVKKEEEEKQMAKKTKSMLMNEISPVVIGSQIIKSSNLKKDYLLTDKSNKSIKKNVAFDQPINEVTNRINVDNYDDPYSDQ